MTTSFIYNKATGITDSQILKDAAILLFLNMLDEQVLLILEALLPEWVREMNAEIYTNDEQDGNDALLPLYQEEGENADIDVNENFGSNNEIECHDMTTNLDELQKDHDQLKNDFLNLRTESNKQKNKISENEVICQAMKTQYEEIESNYNQLRKDHSKLEADCNKLRNQNIKIEMEYDKLRTKHEHVQHSLSKLEQEQREMKDLIAKIMQPKEFHERDFFN